MIYVATAPKQEVRLSKPLGVIPSNMVATNATITIINKFEGKTP